MRNFALASSLSRRSSKNEDGGTAEKILDLGFMESDKSLEHRVHRVWTTVQPLSGCSTGFHGVSQERVSEYGGMGVYPSPLRGEVRRG